MNYIEWLRVRNTLKVTAIVFAVFLLVDVVLRLSFARFSTYDGLIKQISIDQGTVVTHQVLSDGTQRTIFDNKSERTHIVVENRGTFDKHITITEPSTKAHEIHNNVTFGSVHIREVSSSQSPDLETTTIDTNGAIQIDVLIAFGTIVALIVATILGAPFARENDGHLDLALTKPVSRERFALGVITVDALGILAASLLAMIGAIIGISIFQLPHFTASDDIVWRIALGIFAPLSWYALIAAATASLQRGYGAIQGFAWPIAGVIVLLGAAHLGDSLLGQSVHTIFWTLSRFLPLTYFSHAPMVIDGNTSVNIGSLAMQAAITAGLFVLYAGIAVAQWRRVEA